MQEDSHYTGYNQHQWGPQDWNGFYNMLRDNDFVLSKAIEDDQELLEGIALTMKSLIFGHITDLWGDAPYSEALKARDTDPIDRKSTRLNSSHVANSYAVFCLKKKNITNIIEECNNIIN